MTKKHQLQPLVHGGAVQTFFLKNQFMNELITEVFVEQPLISPGSANQPAAATPLIGKSYLFTIMAITFEPVMKF